MCDDFDKQNKADWAEAVIQAFGNATPRSACWTDTDAMIQVLTPFMGEYLNHTMLPGSGGRDMESIANSPESGCLEFCPGNRSANMFRPANLYFEHFPQSPWNSFFLLETKQLRPCGVYEDSNGEYEEVVELSPGEYIDLSHYETGILAYDDEGMEIPMPETYRVVRRHMQGKFLIVAKRSIWNGDSATYDGRHNHMVAEQIRELIQHAIEWTNSE
jgi:hypothetical protein